MMPTESGKLGIAMIGSGEIASAYLPAIKAQEDGEAIWCQDISEFQAKRMGEHNGVPWTTDLDTVLADPRVDVVIVATPHATHPELTIKAARAGKHVMCDKPICTTREDALLMIEECKKAGVKLGVNLASRYQPFATVTKDLLDRKVIGEIMLVKVSAYAYKPDKYWTTGWMEGGNTSWRASKKMAGGGIGIMNMTHEIDRLRYCSGLEILHIKGECDTFLAKVEVEDTLAAVWRYNNGAVGVVIAGSNLHGQHHEPTRIFGTKGQLELWEPVRVFTTREDTEFKSGEWHDIEAPRIENNYIPYIADFLGSVRNDTDPPITGEDGFRVLDAILGIYESSERKQTVFMKQEI
jgi:predicted dehydrogenase